MLLLLFVLPTASQSSSIIHPPNILVCGCLVNIVQPLITIVQPSSVPRSRSSDDGLIMKELVTTSALCESFLLLPEYTVVNWLICTDIEIAILEPFVQMIYLFLHHGWSFVRLTRRSPIMGVGVGSFNMPCMTRKPGSLPLLFCTTPA